MSWICRARTACTLCNGVLSGGLFQGNAKAQWAYARAASLPDSGHSSAALAAQQTANMLHCCLCVLSRTACRLGGIGNGIARASTALLAVRHAGHQPCHTLGTRYG